MPTPALSAPAVASSSAAVKPSQCRPGTLAGELRIALVRSTRRLRMERSSTEITDGQHSVLAALSKLGPLTPGPPRRRRPRPAAVHAPPRARVGRGGPGRARGAPDRPAPGPGDHHV